MHWELEEWIERVERVDAVHLLRFRDIFCYPIWTWELSNSKAGEVWARWLFLNVTVKFIRNVKEHITGRCQTVVVWIEIYLYFASGEETRYTWSTSAYVCLNARIWMEPAFNELRCIRSVPFWTDGFRFPAHFTCPSMKLTLQPNIVTLIWTSKFLRSTPQCLHHFIVVFHTSGCPHSAQ